MGDADADAQCNCRQSGLIGVFDTGTVTESERHGTADWAFCKTT